LELKRKVHSLVSETELKPFLQSGKQSDDFLHGKKSDKDFTERWQKSRARAFTNEASPDDDATRTIERIMQAKSSSWTTLFTEARAQRLA
jgi:hypothetical protein